MKVAPRGKMAKASKNDTVEPSKEKTNPIVDEIEAALANKDIPHVYGNGFHVALGIGDITLLLKTGKMPAGVVSLSYTVAKTLSVKLQEMIGALESASNQKILTTDDIKTFITTGKFKK